MFLRSGVAIAAFYSTFVGAASIFSSFRLESRQANSAIAAASFLRRAYHASVVVDGFVYIDGGEFSYKSGSDIVYQYSNTLISIDLRKDWNNATVVLGSTSKPEGIPNLVAGGIWYDEDKKLLYTGFAGRRSTFGDAPGPYPSGLWSFKPDGVGSGTFSTVIHGGDAKLKNISRPVNTMVASGGGFGYVLDGNIGNSSAPDIRYDQIPITGLLKYDMAKQTFENTTTNGLNGTFQLGQLHYIPNFGSKGILVALGGDTVDKDGDNGNSLVDMGKVKIYDPAKDQWYTHTATGNTPEARKEFCVAGVASSKGTYEIFMYAGWNGNLGSGSIPYDEAYILTLPGFFWVKVNYPAQNPRHGLTCNAVGGSQILTIGGLYTATRNTPGRPGQWLYTDVFNQTDPFKQGLGVFDMNSLTWATTYKADAPKYTRSDAVNNFYANNPKMPNSLSNDVKLLLSAANFPKDSDPPSEDPKREKEGSSPSTGAIAGGVVGGIAGIALIAALVIFLLRRRKSTSRKSKGEPSESAGVPIQEIHGNARHELPVYDQNQVKHHQGQSYQPVPAESGYEAQQKAQHDPPAELPASPLGNTRQYS